MKKSWFQFLFLNLEIYFKVITCHINGKKKLIIDMSQPHQCFWTKNGKKMITLYTF